MPLVAFCFAIASLFLLFVFKKLRLQVEHTSEFGPRRKRMPCATKMDPFKYPYNEKVPRVNCFNLICWCFFKGPIYHSNNRAHQRFKTHHTKRKFKCVQWVQRQTNIANNVLLQHNFHIIPKYFVFLRTWRKQWAKYKHKPSNNTFLKVLLRKCCIHHCWKDCWIVAGKK